MHLPRRTRLNHAYWSKNTLKPTSLSRKQAPRRRAPRQGGRTGGLGILVFAPLALLVALYWQVPRPVALAYWGMSLLCFAVYAWDKFAARAGRWRTQENTLLLLGLLCGWPGAVLAQQLLRHKVSKDAFRRAFWATVVLNGAGFLALRAWR